MLHTGNLVSDLYARVDNLLELHRKERLERENSKLCVFCRTTLGEHSAEGSNCPNMRDFGPFYRISQFRELRCQAGIGRHENMQKCDLEVIPGTEYCKAHSQED